jgi:hypothetical protein
MKRWKFVVALALHIVLKWNFSFLNCPSNCWREEGMCGLAVWSGLADGFIFMYSASNIICTSFTLLNGHDEEQLQ